MRSVILFSVHKAGTMFVHRLTDYVTHQIDMQYYSPNKGNFPDVRRLTQDMSQFNGKQGCFGPLRQYCPVENLEDYNVILHLRDPRDVLVSLYFMMTHKTPGPRRWMRNVIKAYPYPNLWKVSPKEVMDLGVLQLRRLAMRGHYRSLREQRGAVLEGGVDAYVLQQADTFQERYETYCDKLLNRDNVTFLRYEDMVLDFGKWYADFIKPFGEDAEPAVDHRMMDKLRSKFDMRGEDRKSHKRKVTPGDHRDKLKPETIDTLNERFLGVLKALGYQP